jgi:hypothetical protein
MIRAEQPGGDTAFVLPAGNPYERQLLAEYVRCLARRRGTVRVRLGGREWLVAWRPRGSACDACGAQTLHLRSEARDWCPHCALEGAVTRSARGICCATVAPARLARAASA